MKFQYRKFNHQFSMLETIIALFAALFAGLALLPVFNQYMKKIKFSRESRKHLEDQKRLLEAQPKFEIQHNPIPKLIKFHNKGSKAFQVGFVGMGFITDISLKSDRYEAETNEVVTLFLGDNFDINLHNNFQISIIYADIDGSRYQQTYIKQNALITFTDPERVVTRHG
jgi:hypothetical protein